MRIRVERRLLSLLIVSAMIITMLPMVDTQAKAKKNTVKLTIYAGGKKVGKTKKIGVKKNLELKVKLNGKKITKGIKFYSSKKKVAVISSKGKIKTKSVGTTTIKVTVKTSNKKKKILTKKFKLKVSKSAVNPNNPSATPTDSVDDNDTSDEPGGYLFAYFTERKKTVHFALSTDGYYYTPLNGNKSIVTPTIGRQAVRDPYILQGQDGDYYMVATDLKGGDMKTELKVNSDGSYLWGANTSIITWHSSDLVTWDRETKIDILGEYENTKDANQSRVWAPEAIYDDQRGQYMIYWSMEGGSEYGEDLMTWYAYTEDFQTLTSEPKVLYNPGATGLNLKPVEGSDNQDAIDADIVENKGKYYLYYRWSTGENTGTMVAVSDSLTGNYLPVNYDSEIQEQQTPGDLCGSAYVEGGNVFYSTQTERWVLVADHNWSGYYGISESEDMLHWTNVEKCRINFKQGDGNPKHGAVIGISKKQYNALYKKWNGDSLKGDVETEVSSAENALIETNILGTSVIKEDVDYENHTITEYISKNNSTTKTLDHMSIEFSVAQGYQLLGIKGINDLSKGKRIMVVSLTDSNDCFEWTIKGVMCNNPVLGGLYADPDVDVFDGKYYMYPTTDGNSHWKATEFHAFSSEDMVEWKDEGVIMDVKNGDVAWADTENCYAWAPSVEEKNGKYYFYFCARDKSTDKQAIGVAVGDSPIGPFVAEDTPLMTKEKCESLGGSLSQAIDPSIYTEEETGVSYMLFGNGSSGNIVELNDDMISVKEDTLYAYPSGTFRSFMESLQVFKKDEKYHFTWSSNGADSEKYCVRYAVADSLFPSKNNNGTWDSFQVEDRGIILQRDVEKDIMGTGHQSIFKVPNTDMWFIAYARFGTPLSAYPKNEKGYNREVCIDKLSFDSDGYLEVVEPTLTGIENEVIIEKNLISIHDPSVYHDPITGNYFTFGSHLLAAKSSDLINWSYTANSEAAYGEENQLFTKNYKEEFAEVYNFTMPDGANENAWAPDIIYNTAMKKYCMYISIVDGGQKCCIAMATSDNADGPYSYQGMIVCSGINYKKVNGETKYINDIGKTNVDEALGITEEEAAVSKYASLSYNCPDAIDATVFYDYKGNLWMVYGSFTTLGGIRLLKLDPKTGLRGENYPDSEEEDSTALGESDPYYGLKIATNYGEGSYIQEVECDKSPTGYYYYLWYSQGELQSKGSYNMRMFRSENVEGPYVDAAGAEATSKKTRKQLGVRVMDDYKFSFMDVGYTSCGGNSATSDDNGKLFLQFHQKYANGTENHNVRTHQTFVNEDGWLVTAPLQYKGEEIKDCYNMTEVAGDYEFIYHRLEYNSRKYDINESVDISLNSDGTISGAYSGSWTLNGHYITIILDSTEYKGVVLKQWNYGKEVMTFTAVGADNRSLWGVMK